MSNDNNQNQYSINNQYSSHYDNNYEPERYREMSEIHLGIESGFCDFLEVHEEYSYLRSIDVNKATIGDQISCSKGTGTIVKIIDGLYNVQIPGTIEIVELYKEELKPVDEFINRLKIADIFSLYTHIRKSIDMQLYGEIEYFFVFSEYFKINEKTLYNALSVDIQTILMAELNKRTGIFKKKDVEPKW